MDAFSKDVLTQDACEIAPLSADGTGEVAAPASCCERLLRDAGLRPTRQRLMLGQLLFLNGHRHVTAETLYDEAIAADARLSLATVYNTLNQFTEAGLLRRIAADGTKSFFDTDTTVHPHFYLEGEDVLVDISQDLAFEKFPEALPGHEIARLDVIVHIRKKRS
jgi:Fur family iron response transcriptional regulator